MNGAEALVRTSVSAGVEVCFANPGTTEMPLVAALDTVPGIRSVLGLFEGVCTGAADGYARMADRPAITLLHLGPGLANGSSNLHNARRAHSPIVNWVGDHTTWHLPADPPLASDIAALAGTQGGVRSVPDAKSLAAIGAEALAAACAPPGGPVTLVIPADCQWNPAGGPAPPVTPARPATVADASVRAIAGVLGSADRVALLLGGRALRAEASRDAARIAARTGARVFCETFPARMERGRGRTAVERFPYFPEQGAELLGQFDALVLVGAGEPVGFFGYEGMPSRLTPSSCALHTLATPAEDAPDALAALADACGARDAVPAADAAAPTLPPDGPLDPGAIGAAVSALLPEGAIVVEEAITSGLPFFLQSGAAAPHDLLMLTGGSLGLGLPAATGAAIACPDRKVVSLQADGSGLYTLQALWTQARESLDVVTLVYANRSYRILQIELARAGIAEPGPAARSLTNLTPPTIDWCALAKGFGVPAQRVETVATLTHALKKALAEPGPRLIEMLC